MKTRNDKALPQHTRQGLRATSTAAKSEAEKFADLCLSNSPKGRRARVLYNLMLVRACTPNKVHAARHIVALYPALKQLNEDYPGFEKLLAEYDRVEARIRRARAGARKSSYVKPHNRRIEDL